MLDITDKRYQPSVEELAEYVGNPLFERLLADMENAYQPLCSVEYSGDKVLLGWNLRLRKAGRTLCRLYPRPGRFGMLVVIGPKEKARAEALLPSLCEPVRHVYQSTGEGMGQRWLIFELNTAGETYRDVLALVHLRRESR